MWKQWLNYGWGERERERTEQTAISHSGKKRKATPPRVFLDLILHFTGVIKLCKCALAINTVTYDKIGKIVAIFPTALRMNGFDHREW